MAHAAKRSASTSASSTNASTTPPQRSSTFVRVWVRPKEAWPIFAILGTAGVGLVTFMVWKLRGPEYNFSKSNRSTIDYLQNDKDPEQAKSWAQSAFRQGPGVIQGLKIVNKPATGSS